ncbi:hypothetical protein ACSSQN_026940, partial [Raoultella planticola]|uniref:hypothetical protein n=1 Tax=Raoultella planticola TaxID=575 RepID=UPI003FD6C824
RCPEELRQDKKKNAASKPLRHNYPGAGRRSITFSKRAKGYRADRFNTIPGIERSVFCTAFQT